MRIYSYNYNRMDTRTDLTEPFLGRKASKSSAATLADEQLVTVAANKTQFNSLSRQGTVMKELQVVAGNNLQESKRNLDLYLDDISHSCRLSNFYEIIEVFSRNKHCPIVGVLYKIKDLQLGKLYNQVQAPIKDILPQNQQNEQLNKSTEVHDEEAGTVLKFSKHDSTTNQGDYFYQRTFRLCDKVQLCSVSDNYIVYTVIENVHTLDVETSGVSGIQVAKQTYIVVIDIKGSKEVIIANPFKSAISAVYADDNLLMLGSANQTFETKPVSLFEDGQPSFIDANTFAEQASLSSLPREYSQNCEIYAFWHTKNATTVEIFAKSVNEAQIHMFRYKTVDGQAKFERMQTSRDKNFNRQLSVASSSTDSKLETMKTIDLTNLDVSKTIRFDGRSQGASINSPALKPSINFDEEDQQEHLSAFSQEQLSESSDDRSPNSDDEQSQDGLHLEKKLSNKQKRDSYMGKSGKQTMVVDPYVFADKRPGSMSQVSDIASPAKASPQKGKFTPKLPVIDENAMGYVSGGQNKIVRIKFNWRTSFIFRSDGHLDFISSNNTVYTTRHLDFEQMEYVQGSDVNTIKTKKNPIIKDAVCEDNDLLLITDKDEVYLFNLDKYMLSKTKIKVEQALLSPYQDRVQLFPQFLIYDNILIVAHAHFLSVYDMNTKVTKEKPFRHLIAPMEEIFPIKDNKEMSLDELRMDPFNQCTLHIRMIKMREHAGVEFPRIIVMFQNNIIRTLSRDTDMKWQYEQLSKRSISGTVMEVIQSVKSSSLMLLRHKQNVLDQTSSLAMFYFKDTDDQKRWNVLDGLQDHQRVFQISLSNRFMADLSRRRPIIGVYDEIERSVTVLQLDPTASLKSERQVTPQKMKIDAIDVGGYGEFKPIYKIENFRLTPQDIVRESGREDFIYMARENCIYKLYTDEQALKATQKRQKDSDLIHPNLELVAQIEARNPRMLSRIESFRIINDNRSQYIYASSKNHVYFNSTERFGTLQSDSKLLQPTLAKCNYALYMDEAYNQFAIFNGPFEIVVLPYLHTNRLSLRGIAHEPNPIFYQTRGKDSLHMLTRDCQLKTWNTTTGKLVYSHQLDKKEFTGFKSLNMFRNRAIICKQDMSSNGEFIYLCVEIVSKKKVKQYAKIVSVDKINFYVNCNNDMLLLSQQMGNKRSFEIKRFDKETGMIADNRLKSFSSTIPLTFLSPSFEHYIYPEHHTRKIKVRETFTNKSVCTLPQHFYKFMMNQREVFSSENLIDSLIFIEDEFILMVLDKTTEIIFHVPTQRVLSTFNTINIKFNFNGVFLPMQWEVQLQQTQEQLAQLQATQASAGSSQLESLANRMRTRFQSEYARAGARDLLDQDAPEELMALKSQEFVILKDLMFMNMKRYRHNNFMASPSMCAVIRDREGCKTDFSLQQHKLQSILPFSFALWKLIDDLTGDRSVKISDVGSEQLAAACYCILPNSYEARLLQLRRQSPELVEKLLANKPVNYETLLHKMTVRNPTAIRELLDRMKKEWPRHVIPHVSNSDGVTPLKLAHETHHRMVVGQLLDHLKDYPVGYCDAEVASMTREFLQEKFERRVGAYLTQRFHTPLWVKGYEVGTLKLTEQGINQTSINNWPAVTKHFEKKFFSKDAREVPTKLELLDCPNIHCISSEESRQLLISLTTCDILVFSHRSIQAVIEYWWDSARPAFVKWLLLPFFGYLITFQVFLYLLFNDDLLENDEHNRYQYTLYAIQALLLMFAIYLFNQHYKSLKLYGFKIDSAAMLWSWVDLIPLMANLLSIAISIYKEIQQRTHTVVIGQAGDDSAKDLVYFQRPIYSFAVVFLWLKVFYYLRIFREVGHLIRMIFAIIHQMRYFFIVFFLFIVSLGNAFYALNGAELSYVNQVLYVFMITIRKSETDSFSEQGYEALLWMLFIVTSCFFTYIILNMTVAQVKTYLDQNNRIKTESAYKVMAQLAVDCLDKIKIPDEERVLFPPETTDYFVAEPPQYDAEESRFKVRFRPTRFCNQYLMVAQPEQDEDDEPAHQADAVKSLKELKVQVMRGFRSLQAELQQQEMASNDHEGKGEVDGAAVGDQVAAHVDKRLKEIEERHASEIQELKEAQQEMLKLLRDQANSREDDE